MRLTRVPLALIAVLTVCGACSSSGGSSSSWTSTTNFAKGARHDQTALTKCQKPVRKSVHNASWTGDTYKFSFSGTHSKADDLTTCLAKVPGVSGTSISQGG